MRFALASSRVVEANSWWVPHGHVSDAVLVRVKTFADRRDYFATMSVAL
jgi:hypothetical protein